VGGGDEVYEKPGRYIDTDFVSFIGYAHKFGAEARWCPTWPQIEVRAAELREAAHHERAERLPERASSSPWVGYEARPGRQGVQSGHPGKGAARLPGLIQAHPMAVAAAGAAGPSLATGSPSGVFPRIASGLIGRFPAYPIRSVPNEARCYRCR
jgi:hypothetical protein